MAHRGTLLNLMEQNHAQGSESFEPKPDNKKSQYLLQREKEQKSGQPLIMLSDSPFSKSGYSQYPDICCSVFLNNSGTFDRQQFPYKTFRPHSATLLSDIYDNSHEGWPIKECSALLPDRTSPMKVLMYGGYESDLSGKNPE